MGHGLDAVLAQVDVLRGRAVRVDALGGGLTNRSFRVRADGGGDYVVRVGDSASGGLLALDRGREHVNTERAWRAGVGPPVIQALPQADVLVTRYLPGRALAAADLRDPAMIPRVAAAVRALHAGPAFDGSLDLRERRRRYLRVVQERGFRLPDGYLDLQPRAERLEDALRPGAEPLVPCHNDLTAANVIDDGRRIWLIDYEYAAMNEASFELGNLAAESGLDEPQTEALVTAYWGRPSPAKLARAQAWALLARYTWTLWASIQAGASTVDFDFWGWGAGQYAAARAGLAGPRLDALLRALRADPAGGR